jgi:hypothetical protein
MKINYRLLLIIFLLILSSGCAKGTKDGIYGAIYDANNSRLLNGNPANDPVNDPANATRDKEKSYEAYKREREKVLKEGQISEEQMDFLKNQDMPPESTQEKMPEDTGFSNTDDTILSSSAKEPGDN